MLRKAISALAPTVRGMARHRCNRHRASLYAIVLAFNLPFGAAVAASCEAAKARAAALLPLAKGEMAAVQVRSKPEMIEELAFLDGDQAPKSLASFRGKVVLLNLWATWCAPCRAEMPALDSLQGELGGDKFQVVAVNIDTRNLDKPKAFLDEIGVKRLAFFSDPQAKIFVDLKRRGKAFGMPTTVLIDAEGCEIANLQGPAHWASEDAKALIRAAVGEE